MINPEPLPLVLRWRIHEGRIPLRQRHLRSLEPLDLPEPLRAWIHERLEWALANMLTDDTEGVLVLHIDPAHEVTVSLDPVRERPVLNLSSLLVEGGLIIGAEFDGETLEGTVWLECDGALCASCDELISATGSLAKDLCETLKLPLSIHPQHIEDAENSSLFLISDEFGFVLIQEHPCGEAPATSKLEECFSKLWSA